MGIAWSLGVEEKFYLLWPAVFIAARGRWWWLLKVCLVVIGLIWINKLVLLFVVHAPFRYFEYAFDTRVDVILAGCALALGTRLPEAQRWFTAVARRPWWLLLTIAFLIATVMANSGEDFARLPAYFTFVVTAQIPLLLVLFVQLLTWADTPLARLLSSNVARGLGALSYGIYLYHYPILWLAKKFLAPRLGIGLLWLAELLLPLLAALLSYRFLEQPFLRLKQRLGAR